MQAHEQTQFLSAVSTFVQEKINEAVKTVQTPLLARIDALEKLLLLHDSELKTNLRDGKISSLDDRIAAVSKTVAELNVDDRVEAIIKEKLEIGSLADWDDTIDQCSGMIREAIEKLPKPENGKDGADGKDAEINWEGIRGVVASVVENHFKQFPVVNGKDGAPGKDAVIPWDELNEQLSAGINMLHEQLKKMFADMPKPKDGAPGKDVDMDVVADVIQNAVAEHVGVVSEIVEKAVAGHVQTELETWPKPKDGKDGKDGRDGIDGTDGKSISVDELRDLCADLVTAAVDRLPEPRHVVSAHIDRDGELFLVHNDGGSISLGRVVGRDASREDIFEACERLVAEFPRPKDGVDGKDGIDFTHAKIEQNERDVVIVFGNEAHNKELRLGFYVPSQIQRGMFNADATEDYQPGDTVTLGGSQWTARVPTKSRPDTDNPDWFLSVKRGRDGKQGPIGPAGKDGKDGKPGRDLTQTLFSGEKI